MTTTTTEIFPIMKGNASMATGADPYFEVPLFSHVIDNLWQGCSPSEFPDGARWLYAYKNDPAEIDNPRFDKILNLFQWGEYVVPSGTERVTVEMYDSAGVPDDKQVDDLANKVITWLDEGSKVLVHCQAGLNRSSLIVARVLMKSYGMTPDEAIDRIRNRSPLCLCNDSFRQYVKGLK
jgi:hypothetical protein